jgi:hypothetical protein
MVRAGALRRILLVLLILTCAIAMGFIIIIAGNLENGVVLHEIAGLILLVLLIGALWAAIKLRSIDARLVVRVGGAIVFLVVAAVLGAVLAATTSSGVPVGLPLVPLTLLLVATIDGIRIARNLPVAAVPYKI